MFCKGEVEATQKVYPSNLILANLFHREIIPRESEYSIFGPVRVPLKPGMYIYELKVENVL